MPKPVLYIWAIIATALSVAISWQHFAPPNPLIQIPEWGHRLYSVPPQDHATAIELLRRSGLSPYGTFQAGVRQTLFRDGVTVIASGRDIQFAAISRPTQTPLDDAEHALEFLASRGVKGKLWFPPEPELKGKLVVLRLPWGWEIAYRLPGREMPYPKWEE